MRNSVRIDVHSRASESELYISSEKFRLYIQLRIGVDVSGNHFDLLSSIVDTVLGLEKFHKRCRGMTRFLRIDIKLIEKSIINIGLSKGL